MAEVASRQLISETLQVARDSLNRYGLNQPAGWASEKFLELNVSVTTGDSAHDSLNMGIRRDTFLNTLVERLTGLHPQDYTFYYSQTTGEAYLRDWRGMVLTADLNGDEPSIQGPRRLTRGQEWALRTVENQLPGLVTSAIDKRNATW